MSLLQNKQTVSPRRVTGELWLRFDLQDNFWWIPHCCGLYPWQRKILKYTLGTVGAELMIICFEKSCNDTDERCSDIYQNFVGSLMCGRGERIFSSNELTLLGLLSLSWCLGNIVYGISALKVIAPLNLQPNDWKVQQQPIIGEGEILAKWLMKDLKCF